MLRIARQLLFLQSQLLQLPGKQLLPQFVSQRVRRSQQHVPALQRPLPQLQLHPNSMHFLQTLHSATRPRPQRLSLRARWVLRGGQVSQLDQSGVLELRLALRAVQVDQRVHQLLGELLSLLWERELLERLSRRLCFFG